jgi:peptide/nickel transport system ATP-binding protein
MLTSSPAEHRDPSAGGGDDLLVVEDLSISVQNGARTAVRDVSLRFGRGQTVGLVGESGSGKTLTCRAILGVLPERCELESGRMAFDGIRLDELSRRRWEAVHGTRIGAVFQDPASYLNPSLTVGRQLAEVLRVKTDADRHTARTRTLEMFATVGLHDPERVWGQYPTELSGGMLQRVLIAIAISCDPALLIADEATTALDVTIQAEILALLLRLREQRDLSVIFVSHDLAVIAELCDRIVVFYAGEVVEDGPAAEILERPRHPYTQALLRVASVGDYRRRRLDTIPGQPPEVGAAITGCRFAGRCEFAIDACRARPIVLGAVDPGHDVRCVRADDPAVSGRLAEVMS